jgi:hypothetical protein
VQEVAKASGKAIEAARDAGGFIARFISGPLEQGIGIYEDKLKYIRWERQVRLMRRAEEELRKLGLSQPTRPIPLKVAIPLFQGASLEEDDTLQDRWVRLLVNAANAESGIEVHRSHTEILAQITPAEAAILDTVYALPYEATRYAGVITELLPVSARVATNEDKEHNEPPEPIKLALGRLARNGCLTISTSWGGGEMFSRINPTVLGRDFVAACRASRNS